MPGALLSVDVAVGEAVGLVEAIKNDAKRAAGQPERGGQGRALRQWGGR
jgi:hypothetical protein